MLITTDDGRDPTLLALSKARTLSIRRVFEMNDEQAFKVFKKERWGEDKAVTCPMCSVVHEHYFIATCRQLCCKYCNFCNYTLSVTSGMIFAFHKLPLKMYLAAIAICTNAVKGIFALQMGRDSDAQYKTAFVLCHKIRESLMERRDDTSLSGEIHMDDAHVNGHIRPKNKKEDRIDRRLLINQRPDERCVFVMRQKTNIVGNTIQGAIESISFVTNPASYAAPRLEQNIDYAYWFV